MDDQVAAFVSDNNGQVLYRYDTINGVAINVPGDAASKLNTLKNVKYIEKDITFHATLDKATSIVGAPQVWDLGYTGKGVKVALVDSGIDGSHPDLKGRIVEWKDLVSGKDTPYDDFGHGTHCAGIIGGNGAADNGKYKGVAPEVSFIGVKVLGKDGSGSLSTILNGINYAAKSDAQIISMSLGSDEHSEAMDDAVCKAVENGKIVICAAGNSGPNAKTIGCPSDCKNVISVGATDKNDQIASFSSRGPTSDGRLKPEICAPGKDIVSTRATGIHNEKAIDNNYISMSGTSMACPVVSGSVALMVQKNPKLTAAEVKDILEKTAKPIGSKCPNTDYGYGRISVKSAIDYLDGKLTPTPTPSPVISPTPTPKPSPTPTPGYPQYPYPGGNFPSYPYPSYPYPGYNPGYPYPSYPYPGYANYPGYMYPGYNQ
jgi:serine protease AprX